MFVDPLAEPVGMPRNDRARELFFDYVRAMKPHVAIEALSPVYGDAVVFDDPVWFKPIVPVRPDILAAGSASGPRKLTVA